MSSPSSPSYSETSDEEETTASDVETAQRHFDIAEETRNRLQENHKSRDPDGNAWTVFDAVVDEYGEIVKAAKEDFAVTSRSNFKSKMSRNTAGTGVPGTEINQGLPRELRNPTKEELEEVLQRFKFKGGELLEAEELTRGQERREGQGPTGRDDQTEDEQPEIFPRMSAIYKDIQELYNEGMVLK